MPSKMHEHLRDYLHALNETHAAEDPDNSNAVAPRENLLSVTRYCHNGAVTSETNFILGFFTIENDTASDDEIDFALSCLEKSYEHGDIEAGMALYMVAHWYYRFIDAQKVSHINLDGLLDRAIQAGHPHGYYLKTLELVNAIPNGSGNLSENKDYKKIHEYLQHLKTTDYIGAYGLDAYLYMYGPDLNSSVMAAKRWEQGIAHGKMTSVLVPDIERDEARACLSSVRWKTRRAR